MKHAMTLAILFVCFVAQVAWADADPATTLMTERGKLLVSEDLDKPVEVAKGASIKDLTSGWRLRPGKWEVIDGAMKGTQVAADHHSAVASYPLRFKDAVIQFQIRMDGCRQAVFRVNDADEHVCRVILNKDGFAAQKDDHDHDGPDKAVPFGTVAMPLPPHQWITVLLEIRGDEMVASINGRSIAGAHPLIATDKANFGFVVTGDSASFRRLRVWEALPNKDWAANKAKLPRADVASPPASPKAPKKRGN